MTEAKTLLRLAALAAMWGSSFFWIKLGLAAFTPVQLVLVRLVLGALVLGGLCLAYRDRLPGSRRVWGHLAVASEISKLARGMGELLREVLKLEARPMQQFGASYIRWKATIRRRALLRIFSQLMASACPISHIRRGIVIAAII